MYHVPFSIYFYPIDSATKAEAYIGIRLICQGIEKGKLKNVGDNYKPIESGGHWFLHPILSTSKV